MKIDLDAIESMVSAGATGAVILAYLRCQEAKQRPKLEADRKRKSGGKKRKPAETDGKELDAKGILYRRAEEVCGARIGGVVTKLLEMHAGDVPTVAAIIEQAAKTHRPRDYVNGAMKGTANGTIKGAFAELRLELGGEVDGSGGSPPMRDVTPGSFGTG